MEAAEGFRAQMLLTAEGTGGEPVEIYSPKGGSPKLSILYLDGLVCTRSLLN